MSKELQQNNLFSRQQIYFNMKVDCHHAGMIQLEPHMKTHGRVVANIT